MNKSLADIRAHANEIERAVSDLVQDAQVKADYLSTLDPKLEELDRVQKALDVKSAALVEVSSKYEALSAAYAVLKKTAGLG